MTELDRTTYSYKRWGTGCRLTRSRAHCCCAPSSPVQPWRIQIKQIQGQSYRVSSRGVFCHLGTTGTKYFCVGRKLSCALQYVQQNPYPLLSKCQEHPSFKGCPLTATTKKYSDIEKMSSGEQNLPWLKTIDLELNNCVILIHWLYM